MGAQPNLIVWKETAKKQKYISPVEPLPPNDGFIIAGEDIPIDYKWSGKDVREFIRMWESGLSLFDMAKAWPDRNPDELFDLCRHCLYKRWIQERPGGIFGRRRR